MRSAFTSRLRQALTVIGRRLSMTRVRQLQAITNQVALGRWMSQQGYQFPRLTATREGVFDAILEHVREQRVLYLEFGVWRGESMRYWAKGLKDWRSQLHGFDSFEGLPVAGGTWDRQAFDLGAVAPSFDDDRVTLHPGWFEHTVGAFVEWAIPDDPRRRADDVMVVNCDADLFTSTATVLGAIGSRLRIGDYLYFDDMDQLEHEPRAFEQYRDAHGFRFAPIAASRTLMHVAFQRIA